MSEFEDRDVARDVIVILVSLASLFLAPLWFKLGFYWLHALDSRFPIWVAQLAYWKTMLAVIAIRLAIGSSGNIKVKEKNNVSD